MVRAIIFDFDGLILETEGPDYHSWRELYGAHGCSLPLERWVGVIGTAEHGFDPYAELEAQLGRPLDRTAIRARRRARYAELVAREELLPGVREWIEEARRLGLWLGVASSSSREWVSGHLHRLDLLPNVDALACREDVVRTKPDPALYTQVLDALGVRPAEAVAVEDSPNGVAAASTAGLFCVAVPNDLTRGLPLPGADLLLGSLEDMTLREVLDRSGRNRMMGTAE